jgi:hypothetical protein
MAHDWGATYTTMRAKLRQDHALEMALLDLQILVSVWEACIVKDREFLAYLQTPLGQQAYPGASNATLTSRFTGMLREHERKVARYRQLETKLKTHGLPELVK